MDKSFERKTSYRELIHLQRKFIDFLLFRKDAQDLLQSMETLLDGQVSFKPCQKAAGCPLEGTKILEELGLRKEERDMVEAGENHSLAIARLKLYFLLMMALPGDLERNCTKKEIKACQSFGPETESSGKEQEGNCPGSSFSGGNDMSVSAWCQTLAALRRHYGVLRTGTWIPVIAKDCVFGFLREEKTQGDPHENERTNLALILVNCSLNSAASVHLDLSGRAGEFLMDALDNYSEIPLNEGILRLTLGPLEGRLFLKNRWASDIAWKRQSGILLHPTSLPSNYGVGDMGIGAMEFVDFLEASGQKLWQILPLNPPGYGNSPYQCLSAFAGNPLLIDIDRLVEQGLLDRQEFNELPFFPEDRVCFDEVSAFKEALSRKAYEEFRKRPPAPDYLEFCFHNGEWLEDYCLFMALKSYHEGAPWHRWDKAAASRSPFALAHYRGLLAEEIGYHRFVQYEFFLQWTALKRYANEKGIRIIGDLPIYVAHDSSDVWTYPELFYLDSSGNPVKVAGVPPDEFARTGQLWGNPIYRWDVMEETGFQWWKDRLKHLSKMVDMIRIDHFRGFEAYWEVPAGEDTAINGRWVKGPGEKFFQAVSQVTGSTKIIAEDLGFITPEVEELKEKFGFPGMSIMQFEMKEGRFVVPLYKNNTVAYTGTHDNDTILGWHRKNCVDPPGEERRPAEICWDYIEMAMHTDAETVIIPLQDVLCLGTTARMNTPGTATRNWEWRFANGQLEERIQRKLREVTIKSHRCQEVDPFGL